MQRILIIYDTKALLDGWNIDLEASIPEVLTKEEFFRELEFEVLLPQEVIEEVAQLLQGDDAELKDNAERARKTRNRLRESRQALYHYCEPKLATLAEPFQSGDPLGAENRTDQLILGYAILEHRVKSSCICILTADGGIEADAFTLRQQGFPVYCRAAEHADSAVQIPKDIIHSLLQTVLEPRQNKQNAIKEELKTLQRQYFDSAVKSIIGQLTETAIEETFHWEKKLCKETRNDVITVIFTILSAQGREEILSIGDRINSLFRHSDLCHLLFYNYDIASVTQLLECFSNEIYDHVDSPLIKNFRNITNADKVRLLRESVNDIVKFRLLEYLVHLIHRISADASYGLSNEFGLAANQKCISYTELHCGVLGDPPCSLTYYPVDKYLMLKEKYDAWIEKLKLVARSN